MTAPTDALSLSEVSLSLKGNAGQVDILHDISLDITSGETLGLIGPSGSGKSSLLMVMGGLETATGGRITALGTDITHMNEDSLARFRRDNMGVVFQSFHLIPTMTALENVATPLELAGVKDAFERARAELKTVGLAHRTDHYPAQMSAASSNALRSPGPASRVPNCYWRMSRRAISMKQTARRSSTCSFHCAKSMAQHSSW